ncbi:MAG: hypothetical protein ABIS92_18595, partial [Polyangia bacterium]
MPPVATTCTVIVQDVDGLIALALPPQNDARGVLPVAADLAAVVAPAAGAVPAAVVLAATAVLLVVAVPAAALAVTAVLLVVALPAAVVLAATAVLLVVALPAAVALAASTELPAAAGLVVAPAPRRLAPAAVPAPIPPSV